MSVTHNSRRAGAPSELGRKTDRASNVREKKSRWFRNHYHGVIVLLSIWLISVAMLGYYIGMAYLYLRVWGVGTSPL